MTTSTTNNNVDLKNDNVDQKTTMSTKKLKNINFVIIFTILSSCTFCHRFTFLSKKHRSTET